MLHSLNELVFCGQNQTNVGLKGSFCRDDEFRRSGQNQTNVGLKGRSEKSHEVAEESQNQTNVGLKAVPTSIQRENRKMLESD